MMTRHNDQLDHEKIKEIYIEWKHIETSNSLEKKQGLQDFKV